MIKTIIEYNNAKLQLLGYINKVFGLTQRVVKQSEAGDKVYPAEYCGNGNFTNVTDFDFAQGLSYWKKTGNVRVSESSQESMIGAKRMVVFTYPMQLIISVPKSKLSNDDAYSSDRIANSIAKNLNDNNSALKSQISARKVEINMTDYNDRIEDIFREEMSGTDLKYDYNFDLVAIDFDIIVELNQSCLEDECNYYGMTLCEILNKLVNAQNRRDCILPEFDFADDLDFNSLSAQQIVDLMVQLDCDDCAGTINVYLDGALNQTIVSSDLDAEVVNISL